MSQDLRAKLSRWQASANEYDVVVIGAGVMGLGVAWRLAQAGRRPLVLDRDEPGAGASGAAAGMLAPLAEVDFVEESLLDLKRESLGRYPAFVRELQAATGVELDFQTHGTLVVAIDRDDAETLRHHYEHQRERGLPVEWLSGDQARALEPYLAPAIQAAVSIPSDHHIDNIPLVHALSIAVERAGGRLLSGITVTDVVHDGHRVEGVRVRPTDDPAAEPVALSAASVVVAAGCWTRSLGGLSPAVARMIRPVKGQMLSLRMAPEAVLTRVVRAPDCYMVPRTDGRLIVGATEEEMGFDTRLTGGGLFELLRGAYETLPITYELELLRTWAGLRPGSIDNEPLMGHSAVSGLVMATGHHRNGILLTPINADLVAEAVLSGQDPVMLAPFSPQRF